MKNLFNYVHLKYVACIINLSYNEAKVKRLLIPHLSVFSLLVSDTWAVILLNWKIKTSEQILRCIFKLDLFFLSPHELVFVFKILIES